jgi:cardiolipin synthase (CMP-forming)
MLKTLPNLLTLSRIAVIPLVVGTFYLDHPWDAWLGGVLFAAACVTDWLDGHFARRWQQISAFGRFLDPIADKLLVSMILMMLVAFNRLSALTLFPALIILAREILVSGLREFLAGLRVSVPVSRLAKWKTGIQMGAIGVLLVSGALPAATQIEWAGEALLWLAATLTLVTGYDYLTHGLTHMEAEDAKPKPAPPVTQPTIANGIG